MSDELPVIGLRVARPDEDGVERLAVTPADARLDAFFGYDMAGERITLRQYIDNDKKDPSWRTVARTYFEPIDRNEGRRENEKRFVSTVLLSIDHGHGAYGMMPIIFETMTFGFDREDDWDGYQDRYTNREASERGHAKAVAQIVALKKFTPAAPDVHPTPKDEDGPASR